MRKLQSLLFFVFSVLASAVAQPTITSLTLLNADTDVPIRALVNGDVINYASIGTQNVNIVANTSPATVGSVVFFLDGVRKNENLFPYALAGDKVTDTHINYLAISPAMANGAHTITATAYGASNGGGTVGTTLTLSFTVGNTSANTPPVVNAGANKNLTFPANSTSLTGSASDPGGSIASLLWTKQSGPAATMSGISSPTLSLSFLIEGVYVFRLTATDNQGAAAFDEATVIVISGSSNTPSVVSFTLINADNDQDIRTLVNGDILNYALLPTSNLNIRANTNPPTVGSVVFLLDGVRKNENNAPYAYAGDGISGNMIDYNKISPPMAAGAHALSATAHTSANGSGTSGAALTIAFTITGSTANAPPTVNAGADKFLTLPANSTTLNGSASDPDGGITSYLWTKQSGPAATLGNSSTPTLSLSNLVAGNYVFRLMATDNAGATAYDEAMVIVYPAGGGGGTCAVYNELNGLVVIEFESHPATADWTLRTAVAGYTGTGYYEWRHGNTNTAAISAGTGILTYTIQINNPGRYRLQNRTAAPERTDFNDVWVKFPQGNATGTRGTSTLNLGASWFKVYHNVSNNSWTWETKTKDHEPHDIYVDFPSAGTYQIQFSGRSSQFKIDRFVLYNSSVTTSIAVSTGNAQSSCAGSNKLTDDVQSFDLNIFPNPSVGNITFELLVIQAGKTSITLYDLRGSIVAIVFKGDGAAGETRRVSFDGSHLPKGVYEARIITSGKIVTRQIVLQ